MRAVEILSEITKPDAPPPNPGDPEFEKSKQTFVQIIQQAIAEYSKNLNDMKQMAPTEYKKRIQDRNKMVTDFQEILSNTLIAKGNKFITKKDSNDIGLTKINFSSGSRTQKQAATQPSQTANNAPQPITVGGETIKPGDPRYASMSAALDKQTQKNATGESVEEAVLNLKNNAIVLTPREIDGLATRATQVWYRNRQLKAKNPQLWAQMTGGETNSGIQSTGTSRNGKIISKAVGINQENPEFLQSLVNILYKPGGSTELAHKLQQAGAPKPNSNNKV